VTPDLDSTGPELNPTGHMSCGRVCFTTEEKHFLIHGVITRTVGRKQVYKSGVKIAGYYIKEHTHTHTPLRRIRNSPHIHSQPALHQGKEMSVSKTKVRMRIHSTDVFFISAAAATGARVF